MKTVSVILSVALVLPNFAWAAEDDTPLAKDGKAPFTGVLLSTDSYAAIIKDKATQTKLESQLKISDDLSKFKEQKLEELLGLKQKESDAWRKQAEENAKRTWMEQNGFHVGVAVGAVVTIGLAFAAAQAIKAR